MSTYFLSLSFLTSLFVVAMAIPASSEQFCKKWEQIPLTEANWKVAYDGFGKVYFQSGIQMQPRSIASEEGTHAALVLSKNENLKDFLIKVKYENQKGLRQPSSNSWEVFWLMFNYQATGRNKKTNYFIFKPNGLELGKAWGKTEQDFLFTDSSTLAKNQEDYEVMLSRKGTQVKAYINEKLVMKYEDDQKKKLFNHPGKIGLYTEDADVHVKEFAICRSW